MGGRLTKLLCAAAQIRALIGRGAGGVSGHAAPGAIASWRERGERRGARPGPDPRPLTALPAGLSPCGWRAAARREGEAAPAACRGSRRGSRCWAVPPGCPRKAGARGPAGAGAVTAVAMSGRAGSFPAAFGVISSCFVCTASRSYVRFTPRGLYRFFAFSAI